MANRKDKKSGVGRLGVILSLALTLILAAMGIFGLYWYGDSRPAPAAEREAAAPVSREISLFTAPEPVLGAAPEPAEPVVPGTDDLMADYEDVIYEEDGLKVSRILGRRYVGFLTIVDDPLRVTLGKCPYFGEAAYGRTVKQMAEESGAVLAVNGGGFSDPGGVGTGGMPTGNVIYQGKMLMGYWSPTVGMDADGKLHVGNFNGTQCLDMGLQWAVSYGPNLIIDGEICPNLDTSMGEPRTAVGQREDGAIVIVVLQGRQVQALGVTPRHLAEIMYRYGCVNAGNLDGGASSDIFFQGKYLNVCNTSGGPRPIPTALLVMPSGTKEG